MKKLFFTLTLLAATVVSFAQTRPQKDTLSAPIPEDIQVLQTAASLARYGYKNNAASALTEAALLFDSVKTQEMVVKEGSSETRAVTPESGISFDPKQLITDAKGMAGKDKELMKYIQKVEKKIGKGKTRGAIGGPVVKTGLVMTLSEDQWIVKFKGGSKAVVTLLATEDISDLDLYVYDEYDNLIGYDNDATSQCVVSFTPRWDGYFYIVVENTGLLPNPYMICTN